MEIPEILQKFHQIFTGADKFYSSYGTVKDVNETNRTCTVTPIGDEAEFDTVRLQGTIGSTKGMVLIPKIGSVVGVSFINDRAGFVSLYTEVDKILFDTDLVQFNGGKNGGLINIESLVNKINALENTLNTHTHITTATIGASAVVGVISPTTSQIAPTTIKKDIEDTKITH